MYVSKTRKWLGCNSWKVCGLTSGSSFTEENDIAIGSSSSLIRISSSSIFILMTSLLTLEDCTFVSLHKPRTSASVQLCKTSIPLSVMCALCPPHPKKTTMQAGLILHNNYVPEKWPQNKQQFQFKMVYFLGAVGLTMASYRCLYHYWTYGPVEYIFPIYVGGLISFASTVIFLFTMDISG